MREERGHRSRTRLSELPILSRLALLPMLLSRAYEGDRRILRRAGAQRAAALSRRVPPRAQMCCEADGRRSRSGKAEAASSLSPAQLRHPEVGELGVPVVVEENVLRLRAAAGQGGDRGPGSAASEGGRSEVRWGVRKGRGSATVRGAGGPAPAPSGHLQVAVDDHRFARVEVVHGLGHLERPAKHVGVVVRALHEEVLGEDRLLEVAAHDSLGGEVEGALALRRVAGEGAGRLGVWKGAGKKRRGALEVERGRRAAAAHLGPPRCLSRCRRRCEGA